MKNFIGLLKSILKNKRRQKSEHIIIGWEIDKYGKPILSCPCGKAQKEMRMVEIPDCMCNLYYCENCKIYFPPPFFSPVKI